MATQIQINNVMEFDYCELCGLVFSDALGYGVKVCPRCALQERCDTLQVELTTAGEFYESLMDRCNAAIRDRDNHAYRIRDLEIELGRVQDRLYDVEHKARKAQEDLYAAQLEARRRY